MGGEQGQTANVKMESLSMKHIIAGIIGFLILGVVLSAARAENGYLALGQGSQEPIDITSKKFTTRNIPDGKENVFEGAVKVVQEDVTLTCDKLIIVYDEKKGAAPAESRNKKLPKDWQNTGNIKSITASGNVKITQNERMATAGKALYDNVKRTITLTESPRIWQGRDAGIADTIVMYLDENRSEFRGGDASPIKFTINPGELKKEKEKEKEKKK
jgi:lipopolysaccharide export system protein LptA